jgi:FtsP/CotA-like multicopper oxidase with cupredoxin domain
MSIPNHSFWRIGGDQGLIEEAFEIPPARAVVPTNAVGGGSEGIDHTADPDPTTGILLTPGERADLWFYTTLNIEELPLEWHDTQRGRHSIEFGDECCDVVLAHNVPDGTQPVLNWALINTAPPTQPEPFLAPTTLKALTPIETDEDTPKLPLVFGHTIPDWNSGQTTFFAQAMMRPFMALRPDEVHTVRPNNTYIWEVRNLTGGHHNFHTHGWGFQHIETQFVDLDFPDDETRNYTEPAERLENKDVIRIKRRPGTVRGRSFSITRLAVNFDDTARENQVTAYGKAPTETRSGGWLAHCHILEHSALGMMTFFQVIDIFADYLESGDTTLWTLTMP